MWLIVVAAAEVYQATCSQTARSDPADAYSGRPTLRNPAESWSAAALCINPEAKPKKGRT